MTIIPSSKDIQSKIDVFQIQYLATTRGVHLGFGSVFCIHRTKTEKPNLVQNPNRTEPEKSKSKNQKLN